MAISPVPAPAGPVPAQLRLFRQVLLALVVLAAVLVAVVGSHNTAVAAGVQPVNVTLDAPAAAGGSHALR